MLRSYKYLPLKGEKVLLRLDLNVSFVDGKISDMSRIFQASRTIKDLRKMGAKIIILSHLGRPRGKVNPKYTLRKIAIEITNLTGLHVGFLEDPFADDKQSKIGKLNESPVALLENLRFWPGEEANDMAFAQKLAQFGTLYINDAFSVSHRAHASTHAITQCLPSAAGPTLLGEIDILTRTLNKPKSPTLGMIGGAKVSTKIGLIENLTKKLDHLFIGGAMANTFLVARARKMGKSLVEHEHLATARMAVAMAAMNNCKLMLPQDIVVADSVDNPTTVSTVAVDSCPDDLLALDIGPKTIESIALMAKNAKTILWNGPLGAFEYAPFDHGTNEIASVIAQLCLDKKCVAVAGGGDTLAALKHARMDEKFTYVSTAGGAFLEWLEGKTLPGLDALELKK